MAFKTQNNRISFGRAVAAARTWAIGWSSAEARPSPRPADKFTQERVYPSGYGVLVPTTRR